MQPQQPCPTQSGPAYQPVPTNVVAGKGGVVLSPPAPTVYVTPQNIVHQQSNMGVYECYAHERARRMGFCHITFGILAAVLQIVAVCVSASVSSVGAGFWNGLWFTLCGILAIHSARSKTSCSIIGLMVVSIICSIMCFPLLITSAIGLGMDNNCEIYRALDERNTNESGWDENLDEFSSCKSGSKVFANASMLVLSMAEFVLCMVTSATCCGAVCCGSKAPQAGTIVSQPTTTTTQNVISVTQPAAQPTPQQPYVQPPNTYGQPQPPNPYGQPQQPYPQQPYPQAPQQPYPQQPYPQAPQQPYQQPQAYPQPQQPPAYPPPVGSAHYQAQPAHTTAPPAYDEASAVSEAPLNPTAPSAPPDDLPGKQ